jgi:hypothetical protein
LLFVRTRGEAAQGDEDNSPLHRQLSVGGLDRGFIGIFLQQVPQQLGSLFGGETSHPMKFDPHFGTPVKFIDQLL